jgi:signal transduction histidine kinase
LELVERQRSETARVEAELQKVRGAMVRKTRLAAVGQVAASIAHDLRNPLGAARNAAFWLRRHAPKGEPHLADFLQIIEDEVDRADRIIGGLLELTRSRPVTKTAVELGRLVEEAFRRVADADGVRCRVAAAPDPFPVQADPDQLAQVLVNLATNAVQAMEGKGDFRVEACREGDWDVIVVRDSGPGVRDDVRAEIFEPLVTTKTNGTGLGLTICRQIVEAHGGTIDLLCDERPGAAFRIALPRAENDPLDRGRTDP